jgi:hypothetical protein
MITQEFFETYCKEIKSCKGIEQAHKIKKFAYEVLKTAFYEYQCGLNDAKNGCPYQGQDEIYNFYKIGYESIKVKSDEN